MTIVKKKKEVFNIKIINFFDHCLKKKINKKIKNQKLIHESLSFEKNFTDLKKKYSTYYSICREIFFENNINLIFQELGGFVCHLAIFDASKDLKIKHFFIEPTPLSKNCFFLKNSMDQEDALIINNSFQTKKKIQDYLNSLRKDDYLAINKKDFHLKKKNMLSQILSKTTINALFFKLKNLFYCRRTEFDNLKIHLKDYLKRIINSILNLRINKESLSHKKKFIYYPLHVPLDFALTHRAATKINQIENIKKIFPKKFKLILKEHPLIYSKYNYSDIKNRLNGISVGFFDKNLSSLKISKKADCALTINSKSGLEFLCKGKPVFSLINNYYTKNGLATYVKNKNKFLYYLNNLDKCKPNKKKISNLLNQLFCRAAFFDLYNLDSKCLKRSINTFSTLINNN